MAFTGVANAYGSYPSQQHAGLHHAGRNQAKGKKPWQSKNLS